MTDDITARTRAESSQRLHHLLESSKLQPGEVNPVPPDPPANYGRLPEAGKGGAITQSEREVGVDPVKIITPEKPKLPDNHHPLAPDVVTRRGESLTEPIIPIREDIAPLVQDTEPPSEEDGTILRIPDWNAIPLDDAEAWLEMLRTEETRGAEIINRRHGENFPINYCANPACHKAVPDGKEAFSKTVQDPVTKIYHRLVLCTARCWTIWQKGPGVPRSNPPGANLSSRDR